MMRFKTILVALILSGGLATAVHAAANDDITLSEIRAVRVSTTSITFSFVTDELSLGNVRFTSPDGSDESLTDSTPQEDHLFTLDQLDPARGYTFTLSAANAEHTSNRYVILIAPETIGDLGQSKQPAVDIIAADGTKISSLKAASTTAYESNAPSPWLFLLAAALLLGGWTAYRFSRRTL